MSRYLHVHQAKPASGPAPCPLYKRPAPGMHERPAAGVQRVETGEERGAQRGHSLARLRVGSTGRAGRPLPGALRRKMEASFAADFSGVRVQTGPQAAQMGAVAFARGQDLHFSPGAYQPDSLRGQELIGHELTHVIQQRAGKVAVPQGKGTPINSDPGLESEADALGAKAARGAAARTTPMAGSAANSASGANIANAGPVGAGAAPVQCEDGDDKNDLLGRGIGYGGLAANGMMVRHLVHKYGGSKASGFETGFFGLMRNLNAFRSAPRPIKMATGAMIGGGMLASASTGFTKKLKKYLGGK